MALDGWRREPQRRARSAARSKAVGRDQDDACSGVDEQGRLGTRMTPTSVRMDEDDACSGEAGEDEDERGAYAGRWGQGVHDVSAG